MDFALGHYASLKRLLPTPQQPVIPEPWLFRLIDKLMDHLYFYADHKYYLDQYFIKFGLLDEDVSCGIVLECSDEHVHIAYLFSGSEYLLTIQKTYIHTGLSETGEFRYRLSEPDHVDFLGMYIMLTLPLKNQRE